MDKKTWIMLGMGVAILILAIVLVVPKVTNAYKMEGMQQGVTMCQQQIMNTLVSDLSTRGYTTVTVGGKVITLGIIPTEAQRQALQQQQAAQQPAAAQQGGVKQ